MKSPPYFQIKYNPKQRLISSRWLRVVDSAEYRLALEHACYEMQKCEPMHWLADLNRMTSPNISDQNWTLGLLGHHLPKSKLNRVALVLPDDLFLELVIEKLSYSLLTITENKVQIALFTCVNAAQQWLVSGHVLEEGLFRNAPPLIPPKV